MNQLILTGTKARASRDEMNLAEFPLTVLSTRANATLKTLEFSDHIRAKNGELIQRKWIITGADKFGLPTSSDDEVLLGLIKLTVLNDFKDRKVYFTRYELLRILRWSTEGRSYIRLQKALDRLSGVRIKATNAFYDNEAKLHSTRNFGILDAYEINDGRDTSPLPSFFIWSEVMFKSFQAGFIKKLDLDFYLELQSAVSKRLYRYLDKHFWYKSKVEINLMTLAHEKIGISRNYVYASSLRQQIDPAVEELIAANFLSGCSYEGKGASTTITLYAASAKSTARSSIPEQSDGQFQSRTSSGQILAAELKSRGLNEDKVALFIAGKTENELLRMKKILAHIDQLILSGAVQSPQGFIYRAMEKPDQFVLPGEKKATIQSSLDLNDRRANTKSAAATIPQTKESPHATNYLIARHKAVEDFKAREPQTLARLRMEYEQGLSKLRDKISSQRFAETVQLGVNERIAKLIDFPTLERWQVRDL